MTYNSMNEQHKTATHSIFKAVIMISQQEKDLKDCGYKEKEGDGLLGPCSISWSMCYSTFTCAVFLYLYYTTKTFV